jgi:hypothetical protein
MSGELSGGGIVSYVGSDTKMSETAEMAEQDKGKTPMSETEEQHSERRTSVVGSPRGEPSPRGDTEIYRDPYDWDLDVLTPQEMKRELYHEIWEPKDLAAHYHEPQQIQALTRLS